MFDKEAKRFIAGAVFALVIIITVGVMGIINLESRIETCHEKTGVLVKTTDGWKCIEAKVIS